jgi:type I restriction enzyme R subunit
MTDAGYTSAEATAIKTEVKYYEDIRQSVKLASGDYIDLKMYEPAMRHMIDNYISAEESKKISAFDNMSLVELLVRDGASALDALPESIAKSEEAMAETIENNLRKVIIEERPTNPKYFDEMSALLTELIEERRKDSRYYKKYLDQIVELSKKIRKPTGTYPASLTTQAMRSVYDNLGKDETLAILIDTTIMTSKQDSWIGHHMREKAVKIALKQVLTGMPDEEFGAFMELIKNQPQYR